MLAILRFHKETGAERHQKPKSHAEAHHVPAAQLRVGSHHVGDFVRVQDLLLVDRARGSARESGKGADHDYNIYDRPGQHVTRAATKRDAFPQ